MSPTVALLFYRGYNGLNVVLLCNTGSEQARNACAVKGAHEQREWELHSCRPDHKIKIGSNAGFYFMFVDNWY